jgi:hypothetical protein
LPNGCWGTPLALPRSATRTGHSPRPHSWCRVSLISAVTASAGGIYL